MDDVTVKESRTVLRQAHEHLRQAHMQMGAREESAGMVDVITTPDSTCAALNYVTPRRGTAWVSGSYVETGVKRLRELGRGARVQYIDALFPPQFADTLAKLGLQRERATLLMIYKVDGLASLFPARPAFPALPNEVRTRRVTPQRGARLWQQVIEDSAYRVIAPALEPIVAGDAVIQDAIQEDIVAYRHRLPVGIVRVSLHPALGTAHILALAVERSQEQALIPSLIAVALRLALRRGATVVFADVDEAHETRFDGLGFAALGQMVSFAAPEAPMTEGPIYAPVAQPVLAIG